MSKQYHSTVVFLDTDCLHYLRSDSTRAGLSRQMRLINAVTVGTVINLIEAVRHPSSDLRRRLVDAVRYLAGDRNLAPWPYGLIERVGAAVGCGEDDFIMPPSGLERFLCEDPTEDELADLGRQVEQMEDDFRTIHDEGRPRIQAFIRDHGMRGVWASARAFLDEMWMQPDHIDEYIQGVWRTLDLQGEPRIPQLRENPTWRLFFEAQGVAVFEQSFVSNRKTQFGSIDLLQLIYVTGFRQSIFVTNDGALRRLADVVFEPVAGARVLSWEKFYDG